MEPASRPDKRQEKRPCTVDDTTTNTFKTTITIPTPADEADADGGIASAGPDDTGRAAAVAATG